DNQELVATAARNKNIDLNVAQLIELDDRRRELQQQIDELRAQRNKISDMLQDAAQRMPEVIETGKRLKEETAALEEDHRQVLESFFTLMLKVPNIPSADTPVGKDDTENVEIKKHGEVPVFDFPLRDHVE